jgi:hypothetical protein
MIVGILDHKGDRSDVVILAQEQLYQKLKSEVAGCKMQNLQTQKKETD